MTLSGLVKKGTTTPPHMRQLIYGPPKQGKSVYCGTWPAPLMIHPFVESGYDTFRQQDMTNLFDFVELGKEHHLWMLEPRGKETHKCISVELREWLHWLTRAVAEGNCPYQTIVIGGFNVLQTLVHGEKEKSANDSQKAWGQVLTWSTELIQILFSLPLHIIFECGANIVEKDRGTGMPVKYTPAISGKTGPNLLADVNVILWQECKYGRYYTSVSTGNSLMNGVRFSFLASPDPIENCCYDYFAYAMGLDPIYKADPNHPRVVYQNTPLWPWPHSTF